MAQSQLTSEGDKCQSRSRLAGYALTAAFLSRFSRVLSGSQHVHPELHNEAAPYLGAHSLTEALASVAFDGSVATDQRRERQVP